jgi:hypothetical protein
MKFIELNPDFNMSNSTISMELRSAIYQLFQVGKVDVSISDCFPKNIGESFKIQLNNIQSIFDLFELFDYANQIVQHIDPSFQASATSNRI